MAIKGGSDTPLKNIYVRELRQGGAVHNEGFVQVDKKSTIEFLAIMFHTKPPSVVVLVDGHILQFSPSCSLDLKWSKWMTRGYEERHTVKQWRALLNVTTVTLQLSNSLSYQTNKVYTHTYVI